MSVRRDEDTPEAAYEHGLITRRWRGIDKGDGANVAGQQPQVACHLRRCPAAIGNEEHTAIGAGDVGAGPVVGVKNDVTHAAAGVGGDAEKGAAAVDPNE